MATCVECGSPLGTDPNVCPECGDSSTNIPALEEPDANDVLPMNGPARYVFRLADLKEAPLSDWRLNIATATEMEIRRHWPLLSTKRVWSPYLIHSYCIGAAQHEGTYLFVRYFLFPSSQPFVQNQAVAQLICNVEPGPHSTNIKLWVDALRENELSNDNIEDIRAALHPGLMHESVSAASHYDRAMNAVDINDLDYAINELDMCLCANPEPVLAMEAYYNLSATIWGKFRFNERRGASIGDDEYLWVLECNLCLRRALKIYESLPRTTQLQSGALRLHQAIKGSLSPTINYGGITYEHGERKWRKSSGLPPLRCLTEIDIPLDR